MYALRYVYQHFGLLCWGSVMFFFYIYIVCGCDWYMIDQQTILIVRRSTSVQHTLSAFQQWNHIMCVDGL